MNPRYIFSTSTLAVALLLPAPAAGADDPLAGHWEGAIELPGTKLQIRVDLEAPAAEGEWSGTIDIPAQTLRGYALDGIAVDDSVISFAMPNIPGDPVFSGTLSDDANKLSGTFQQGGQSFPFSLQRTEAAAAETGETPSRGIPGEGLVGIWQGSLRAGPTELRLVLHVNEGASGSLAATLDSLDQGAMGITVGSLILDDAAVAMEIPKVRGSYTGTMSSDGAEIEGTWKQGGGELPLVFKRRAAAPDTSRPQDPQKPYPYDEREVTFENDRAGITLAGTLTVPRGDGPFPGVVLISGSGPQNRDEELLGHRPFLVLADHLTRQGIAVLRYDDRGVAQSGGKFSTATHEDFASDARAAFDFLKQQDKIDPTRVGLCGHSEGGIHAPIVATKSDDVAFIVMLAGVGVPMDQLLKRQRADTMRAFGIEHMEKPEERAMSDEIFRILRTEGATPEARKKVTALTHQSLALYTEAQRAAYGMNEAALNQQLQMMFSPWFIKLLAYDPTPTLAKVGCPVLALNGDKDIQVAADENLEGIRDGLAAGGNENVTIRKLSGLNHLFQQCTTGAIAEYATIEETFNPAALQIVSNWILKTVGNR